MKKFLSLVLTLILVMSMVVGMVSCEKTNVPSDSTQQTEATELEEAKVAAKTALESYVNFDNYRDDEKTLLETTIADGKTAIDAATTVDAVTVALNNSKALIDAIKTDAILNAEELNTAKQEAKEALVSYVNSNDYRSEEQIAINTIIENGKKEIDNATNKSAVISALDSAKLLIDAIKTDGEMTAEELIDAKQTAKNALANYANADDYRDAQKIELALAITNGNNAIDAASDITAINTALANAKGTIDAIETDAEITAKEPTISTPFDSNTVFTSSRATLDVYAKDGQGNKLSMSKVTVTVNGETASVNWDDHIKTSYNFVFVEGENTVVITATDGIYTKVKTYTVVCDLTKPTTVTVSIEAFTVGLGYLVAPVDFELNEQNLSDMAEHYGYESAEDFKEKLSMAHVLDYVLYTYGLDMDYQGALESTWNGFYMSAISGIPDTTISVPEELVEALDANGYYIDECVYDEGTLCEFDVTWGSGWMYTVNGVFPNIPFCDYVPQDGDVMRVQFTLSYGSDIGDWGFMGEPFFEVVYRDSLTKLIAKAIALDVIDVQDAIDVVSTFGVTQDELDAAYAELEAAINAVR